MNLSSIRPALHTPPVPAHRVPPSPDDGLYIGARHDHPTAELVVLLEQWRARSASDHHALLEENERLSSRLRRLELARSELRSPLLAHLLPSF